MNQPNLSTRIALSQLESSEIEYVEIPRTKRKIRIGFLHDYTVQKITELLLAREDMEESAKNGGSDEVMRSAVKHPYFSIKLAVLATLNTPLKIALIYPIKWRWWAFVRKYDEAQIASITMAIQKKNNDILLDVLSHYCVLEGYEDGFDESDEGGSRAIPSRTHTGRIASFVKDFPCYGDTRWIPFVGRIVNYTARCVLTVQQIQLMQSDLPHTLYKPIRKKDGKRDTRNMRVNPNDPAFAAQQAAYDRAVARRKAQQEGKIPYTTQQLFR